MTEPQATLLIVDDEPFNTEIIMDYLEDEGYAFRTAEDGAAAWALLQQSPAAFDAVLLDRMLPNMDGMEVLARIKAHPDLDMLPVILQTARAAHDDMVEGIRAGAYYYLVKPFQEDMLRSVVRTAVRDNRQYRRLRRELARTARTLQLMLRGGFRFRTLDESLALAALIANACPDPGRVVAGLSELLINAVEHGNLAITYEEKTALSDDGRWKAEIERRLNLPQHRDRYAEVEFERGGETIVITIRDQGEGFDWKRYLEFSPDRSLDNHGRGIAVALAMSFDAVEFRGKGNEVIATLRLAPGTGP